VFGNPYTLSNYSTGGAMRNPVSAKYDCFRRTILDDYRETFNSLSSDEFGSAPPPNEAAIRQAWNLYLMLCAQHFLPQMVVPSVEGGVGICFSQAGKYADLECLNTNELLGAMSDRHGCVEVFEVTPTDLTEIEDAISKISRFLISSENAVPRAVVVCC
jgi:hypothetical protein